MIGTCKFCGQTMDTLCTDVYEANDYASFYCSCTAGRRLRDAESAKESVDELFGDDAVKYGFEPVNDDELINFLKIIIDHIAADDYPSVSVSFRGGRTVIKQSSDGKIKVQRTSSNKVEI